MAKVQTWNAPPGQNELLLVYGVHYSTAQSKPVQSSLVVKTTDPVPSSDHSPDSATGHSHSAFWRDLTFPC